MADGTLLTAVAWKRPHVILGDQISDPPPPDDPLEFHDASETKKSATGTDQQQLVSNGL